MLPSCAEVEQRLDMQLRLRRAIEPLLRDLPLRTRVHPEIEADDLATRCIVRPEAVPRMDKAAARLAAAWDDAPEELRLRLLWSVALQLAPDRPAAQLREALGVALPRAIEFLKHQTRVTVRPGAPVTRLHQRQLASALARTYRHLTGHSPSWSGGVDTPFSRLGEAVFKLAGLEGWRHHGRAAVERWRHAYPLIDPKKGQFGGEDIGERCF